MSVTCLIVVESTWDITPVVLLYEIGEVAENKALTSSGLIVPPVVPSPEIIILSPVSKVSLTVRGLSEITSLSIIPNLSLPFKVPVRFPTNSPFIAIVSLDSVFKWEDIADPTFIHISSSLSLASLGADGSIIAEAIDFPRIVLFSIY